MPAPEVETTLLLRRNFELEPLAARVGAFAAAGFAGRAAGVAARGRGVRGRASVPPGERVAGAVQVPHLTGAGLAARNLSVEDRRHRTRMTLEGVGAGVSKHHFLVFFDRPPWLADLIPFRSLHLGRG